MCLGRDAGCAKDACAKIPRASMFASAMAPCWHLRCQKPCAIVLRASKYLAFWLERKPSCLTQPKKLLGFEMSNDRYDLHWFALICIMDQHGNVMQYPCHFALRGQLCDARWISLYSVPTGRGGWDAVGRHAQKRFLTQLSRSMNRHSAFTIFTPDNRSGKHLLLIWQQLAIWC